MLPTCPYCRETIAEADTQSCPTCSTPHHVDCWAENGGCTVFGCASAPPDEPKLTLAGKSAPPIPPPIPPFSQAAGGGAPPNPQAAAHESGHFVTEFVRDRRILLRNMLFVSFVAMPVGGLAGAVIGLGLGFLFALFGAGVGSIFSFPMKGLLFGQAFGVGGGVMIVAILGESFVTPFRRKVRTFARFVFEDAAASSSANTPEPLRQTPL